MNKFVGIKLRLKHGSKLFTSPSKWHLISAKPANNKVPRQTHSKNVKYHEVFISTIQLKN